MTEVDACLQQGFHGYDVRICHVCLFLQINFVFTSGGFIPPADPGFLPQARTESRRTVRNAEIYYHNRMVNASIFSKKYWEIRYHFPDFHHSKFAPALPLQIRVPPLEGFVDENNIVPDALDAVPGNVELLPPAE